MDPSWRQMEQSVVGADGTAELDPEVLVLVLALPFLMFCFGCDVECWHVLLGLRCRASEVTYHVYRRGCLCSTINIGLDRIWLVLCFLEETEGTVSLFLTLQFIPCKPALWTLKGRCSPHLWSHEGGAGTGPFTPTPPPPPPCWFLAGKCPTMGA